MKPAAYAIILYLAVDALLGLAVWRYLVTPLLAALNAAITGAK